MHLWSHIKYCLVSLLLGLIAGYGLQQYSQFAEQNQAIIIGAYGDFSGVQSEFGLSSLKGIQLAVKNINRHGGIRGRKIHIVYQDTMGETERIRPAMEDLIHNHKAIAIIGDSHSHQALVGAQLAQKHGVPFIAPAATSPEVTELGDFIFRICFTDSFQGKAMAEFAKNKLKLKRVAILSDFNSSYSQNLSKVFSREFKNLDGELAAQLTYDSQSKTFDNLVIELKDKDFDGLFIPGFFGDVSRIAQQLKEHGINKPLLGGDGWESTDLTNQRVNFASDGYFSSHYSRLENNAQTIEFTDKFIESQGHKPDAMAALSYDAIGLLSFALNNSRSLSRRSLRNEISIINQYQGVTGEISLNKKRDAEKSAVIMKIQGPKLVFITRIDP